MDHHFRATRVGIQTRASTCVFAGELGEALVCLVSRRSLRNPFVLAVFSEDRFLPETCSLERPMCFVHHLVGCRRHDARLAVDDAQQARFGFAAEMKTAFSCSRHPAAGNLRCDRCSGPGRGIPPRS